MAPTLMTKPTEPLLIAVDNSEDTFADRCRGNFSAYIRCASQAAIKLAERICDTVPKEQAIEVLHVQPHYYGALAGAAGAAELMYDTQEKINSEMEMESAHFLHDKILPKLTQAGFTVKTVLLRSSADGSSSIGAAICKHAEKIGAGAVVLTRTSKSALTKFFTGSVTRYTVDHCSKPVLVFPSE